MKTINPLLATDAYKVSHRNQYHPLTQLIFSNFTPRGDKLFTHYSTDDKKGVIVAGVQGVVLSFVKELWDEGFFKRDKTEVIQEYKDFLISMFLATEDSDFSYIGDLHDLGYLPLEIRCLPEGSLAPVQVPVYTIHNTDLRFGWLTNYFETGMSAETWKPMTIATTAFQYLKLCHEYSDLTCDSKDHIMFQCHDFSARGLSGLSDGYKNTIGHLMSFFGTDTLLAVQYANDYYGMKGQFVGASVPASEHSVATTNIGFLVEDLKVEYPNATLDELRYMAEKLYLADYISRINPTGIASYVLDSFDYWTGVTRIIPELKSEILARDGKLVIRPDSGVPEHIIAGYRTITLGDAKAIICNDFKTGIVGQPQHMESNIKDIEDISDVSQVAVYFLQRLSALGFEIIEHNGDYYDAKTGKISELKAHEIKGTIECLWETFNGEVNTKGYKVLDPHIGLIYGDSITVKRQKDIFVRLKEKGFASSNVVLGVGSFSYQYSTRDTFAFACKATGSIIDGKEILVSKDPKTDSSKKSARGFLKVVKDQEKGFRLVDGLDFEQIQDEDNELRIIFKDGKVYNQETLTQIRERVVSNLK